MNTYMYTDTKIEVETVIDIRYVSVRALIVSTHGTFITLTQSQSLIGNYYLESYHRRSVLSLLYFI